METLRVPIQNLTTGEIFKSLKEAASNINKNSSTFSNIINNHNGKGKSQGYYWAILSRDLESTGGYNQEERSKLIQEIDSYKETQVKKRVQKSIETVKNRSDEKSKIINAKLKDTVNSYWSDPENRIKQSKTIIEGRLKKFNNLLQLISKEELHQKYIIERKRLCDLMSIYNLKENMILKLLNYYGIRKKKK